MPRPTSSLTLLVSALLFFTTTSVRADVAPAIVQLIHHPDGIEELNVFNQSNLTATPFDITMLLVVSNGSFPVGGTIPIPTAPANWTSQELDATLWELPMGSALSGLPTWHQYTNRAYTAAHPSDPSKVLGFYLNYSYDSQAVEVAFPVDPIRPGSGLASFIFEAPVGGSPPSLTFFVAGPSAGTNPFAMGAVQTFSGQTSIVPEPGGLLLLAACGAGLALRSRKA